MVYQGPNNNQGITVYHDGVNKGSDLIRTSSGQVAPSGIVKIGRRFDEPGTPRYGSAHVDELLFFNHMLSPSQINMVKNTAYG